MLKLHVALLWIISDFSENIFTWATINFLPRCHQFQKDKVFFFFFFDKIKKWG